MNFKELENGYRNWLSKQSFPVQVTAVTVSNAIRGAAFGGLVGAAAQVAGHVFPQHSLAIKSKAFLGTPMEEARVFAATRGTNDSIESEDVQRIRGKEDVQTVMAADFVSGATCRLLTRPESPYVAAEAVIVGVVCALIRGGVFKLCEKPSELPKNFEKGLLTDSTMLFLREVFLRKWESLLDQGFSY
ncbi:hypothetical protein MKW92_035595 [Papaver armeniacum]|nr:hypothetical protein MKW92_035595 [Papaver armeniacum]